MTIEGPCCGNCRFFRDRDIDHEAAMRARAAGHVVPEGECRFFPKVVQKRPSEWCGQYQAGEAE